jgi:hypothetical protein
MPERPNGAVLKTVVRKHPGFESLSLRSKLLHESSGRLMISSPRLYKTIAIR